jgi:hypothetical protein
MVTVVWCGTRRIHTRRCVRMCVEPRRILACSQEEEVFREFEEGGVDMKKLICVYLVTLVLASAAYSDCPAGNQKVIGDWEVETDGWVALGSASLNYSTIGVTLNEYSLQVTTEPGWQQAVAYKFQDNDPADFFSHQYFCVDITRIASEWIGEGEWSGLKLIINTDANGISSGWNDLGDDDSWWSPGDSDTVEACWDYSAVRDEIVAAGSNYGYLEFFLVTNTGGYDTIGSYYLDYAVLCGVPEPMTIALLGLGGLALLRRKRA